MLVRDLIEKLEELDQDAPIMLNLDDDRIAHDIYDIDIDVVYIDEGIIDIYLCPKIDWQW